MDNEDETNLQYILNFFLTSNKYKQKGKINSICIDYIPSFSQKHNFKLKNLIKDHFTIHKFIEEDDNTIFSLKSLIHQRLEIFQVRLGEVKFRIALKGYYLVRIVPHRVGAHDRANQGEKTISILLSFFLDKALKFLSTFLSLYP